ncbi:MAG TPA: TonB-dependent receptor [Bacteroidales bacterium]|nr:TonB-dependent receptor [Bacteroidales bacterium]
MKTLLLIFVLIFSGNSIIDAQSIVSGRVTDRNGESLRGANVMVKRTYDGASTDTTGCFKFSTKESGDQVIVVSFIGYKKVEKTISLSESTAPIAITIEEQIGELKGVVISAGAFETGDLKRPIVLKPMDIATTPSAMGDIYGAMTTLPGTQLVGNEGGLYVRGGEGYESKTFIDGMQVVNPYMSKMPDLPTRSRFSPILFTGTAFSTGGYSAEYGQALSSVINLKTTGLAEKTQGSFSLMSVGIGGSFTRRWNNTSLAGTVQYLNMRPYYSLFRQNMEWEKPPELSGGTMLFRQRYRKHGFLKVFGSFDHNSSALYYNYKSDSTEPSLIRMQTSNYYINTVYSDLLSEKWLLKTGLAYSFDNAKTGIDQNKLGITTQSFHQRATLSRDYNETFKLKFGEEASWYLYNLDYYSFDSLKTYNSGFPFRDYALYIEPEIHINDYLAARIGMRGEYLSLMKEWQLVPRISLAYNTGDYSQVSLAYGLFRQRPESQYLIFNYDLKSEKATHLILNYQYELNDRIFRAEVYSKSYNNLVKYLSENSPDPKAYNNFGKGFARGIDLFWRDSKSVRNLDYWISYSYIYTKRDYRDYQDKHVPAYISPHTFSVVAKYFFSKVNTYTGITYMHASPKTWYNPALPFSRGDQTGSYNDLSINITVIRPLFGSYCAFLLNVNNLPGFNNVYGYHYSPNPDSSGNYARYSITPQSKRFFVIAAYYVF